MKETQLPISNMQWSSNELQEFIDSCPMYQLNDEYVYVRLQDVRDKIKQFFDVIEFVQRQKK